MGRQDYPANWQDYREVYARLQKQDQNRFYASSWLGGLTFAAFAALVVAPIPASSVLGHSVQPYLSWLIAVLLAVSTLLFLIEAYSAYVSIRLVSRLSLQNARRLNDDEAKEAASLAGLREPRERPDIQGKNDAETLGTAWHIHDEAGGFITWGLGALGLTLLCVALEINTSVFAIATAILILVLFLSRDLVRNELADLKNRL